MNNIEEILEEGVKYLKMGVKKIEFDVEILGEKYDVKMYKTTENVIRIDLVKKVKKDE